MKIQMKYVSGFMRQYITFTIKSMPITSKIGTDRLWNSEMLKKAEHFIGNIHGMYKSTRWLIGHPLLALEE